MQYTKAIMTLAMMISSGVWADSSSVVSTSGFVTLNVNQSAQIHVLNAGSEECSVKFKLIDHKNTNLLSDQEVDTVLPNTGEWSTAYPPKETTPTAPTAPTTDSPSSVPSSTNTTTPPLLIRGVVEYSGQEEGKGCSNMIPTLEIMDVVGGVVGNVAILNTAFYDVPVVQSNKTKVCHKDKTIEISRSALKAHTNHGDKEGECTKK